LRADVHRQQPRKRSPHLLRYRVELDGALVAGLAVGASVAIDRTFDKRLRIARGSSC
jgi:hypothetical protein